MEIQRYKMHNLKFQETRHIVKAIFYSAVGAHLVYYKIYQQYVLLNVLLIHRNVHWTVRLTVPVTVFSRLLTEHS